MNKTLKKILWISLLILILITIYFLFIHKYPQVNQSPSKPTPTIFINYSNLKEELSKSPILRSIPEDEEIQLRFYNFYTGVRKFEKSYILRNTGIEEGLLENPEITILISSKYLSVLTNKNFCSVLKIANENKDLGVETTISNTKLIWRYKSMNKYKDCLF